MDNKKFEQLIDLIINENEEQARSLFHDIVVEKSREIYESLMDEEMDMDEDDSMEGTQVGSLLDEISADEEGMTEEEDLEFDDEEIELGDEEDHEEGHGEEDLEDRVVDLEDKLDQLMAEFEEIMGSEEGEEGEEGEEMDFDAEEGEEEEEGTEEMMEAIELQKVAVTHGDNGAQTKSTVAANAGARGMASRPVKFSGDTEAMPSSPKAPSNAYARGEGEVKHAGQWKNAPAQKGQSLDKAPAPVKTQASGVNTTSPVAESKKAKKRI